MNILIKGSTLFYLNFNILIKIWILGLTVCHSQLFFTYYEIINSKVDKHIFCLYISRSIYLLLCSIPLSALTLSFFLLSLGIEPVVAPMLNSTALHPTRCWPNSSETRFGEIPPLLQQFTSLWLFLTYFGNFILLGKIFILDNGPI